MTDPPASPAATTALLGEIAARFTTTMRAPVLGSPASVGLAFEEVVFPATDGVALEGWFVPASSPRATVIATHPRGFSRTGLPADQEPWRAIHAETGNDIAVDFLPDIRVLHDAGYEVLAFDLRNSGWSGAANGGVTSSGRFEARDVRGALRFVRSRSPRPTIPVALVTRCLGANAAFFAMSQAPDEFDQVRCVVACQPLSPAQVLRRTLERRGVPIQNMIELDRLVQLRAGFTLADLSPVEAARSVRPPTLMYQVRDDVMTRPDDVQAIHDAVGTSDKELFWIDGTTRRWDGYLHFQRHPDRVLAWLDRHTRS
ncbi:alpha/beta hydrolase [uncultured Williamsia sp.]|uniref:alpha/beta hydrolase n=1 Tax=uncultured Williamsia sp. TaxID=259311 RepID=UPI002621808B|nr:alpha/beta hydrolase [uncultured Williamsia sp.]